MEELIQITIGSAIFLFYQNIYIKDVQIFLPN